MTVALFWSPPAPSLTSLRHRQKCLEKWLMTWLKASNCSLFRGGHLVWWREWAKYLNVAKLIGFLHCFCPVKWRTNESYWSTLPSGLQNLKNRNIQGQKCLVNGRSYDKVNSRKYRRLTQVFVLHQNTKDFNKHPVNQSLPPADKKKPNPFTPPPSCFWSTSATLLGFYQGCERCVSSWGVNSGNFINNSKLNIL